MDAIDFGRQVARFGATDVEFIVDVLRSVYTIRTAGEQQDSQMTVFLGDFIEALEECDSIEIVEEENLIDEA